MIHDHLKAKFSVNEPDPIMVASIMADGHPQWMAEEIAGSPHLSRLWKAGVDHRQEIVEQVSRCTPDPKNSSSVRVKRSEWPL